MKHPIQPLVKTESGVIRFKENKIVSKLLTYSTAKGYGLNEIARDDFPKDDHVQLAQLIGYSHSGAGELSYMTDYVYDTSWNMYEGGKDEKDARIEYLEKTLKNLKEGLRDTVAELYGKHPEDLDIEI